MKKIISLVLSLSMIMTATFVVKAEDKTIDAYSSKITTSQNNGIYKQNGNTGELTSNGKYGFSNGNSAVLMFRKVNFGTSGVAKAVVDLGGAQNNGINPTIKLYAYPAGTAPFINYSDNSFNYDTYNVSGSGAIVLQSSNTAIERTGDFSVDGTTNQFAGWGEGLNAFEIQIPLGSKMTGEYDIFVGTNYGTLHGISFVEYEKKATNYLAWNEYNRISNEHFLLDGKEYLHGVEKSGLIVYRDVDFGNVGVKGLNLELALSSANNAGITVFLVKKGDVYNEDWTLKEGYTESGNQIQKNGNNIASAGSKAFTAESDKNWKKETYTIDISNGTNYRGVYDVVIGVRNGIFYGMTFEMIEHETTSAYTKLAAEKAINLGDSTFSTSAKCYAMSSGSKKMVLYKNVDFGEKGANKIILDAKLFTNDAKGMRIYLVRPDEDQYTDELGRLNGYTLSQNYIMKDVDRVPGTMGTTFSTGYGVQKEVEINIADANYTDGPVITGVYNVYVGLEAGNFYGIQFVEAAALDVNTTEFSAKNYNSKTNYPLANMTTGKVTNWGDYWDAGAEKRYAMWYADFGNEAGLATVDVYYGVTKEYANCYVTLYADEFSENNILARGVLTYQEGMDWSTTDKYMTLPVKKTLTGVHKIYLSVENSPYLTGSNPAGNIVKFVFNNADNYTRINSTYGNEEHSSLIFNKENDNRVFHALAIYLNDRLIDVDADVITPIV